MDWKDSLQPVIFLYEHLSDHADIIGADVNGASKRGDAAGFPWEAARGDVTGLGRPRRFPEAPEPVGDGVGLAVPEHGEFGQAVAALGGDGAHADGLADLDVEGTGVGLSDHGAVRPRRWSLRLPCSRVRRPARMSSTMALPSWVRFPSADKFPRDWGGRGGSSFLFSSLLFLDRDVLARSAWVLSS